MPLILPIRRLRARRAWVHTRAANGPMPSTAWPCPWAHPAFLQYARTKLANVLFTTERARRLAGSGITANCLHPGVVASDFGEGNGTYGWFMRRYIRLRGISVEAGAAGSILLATSPALEQVSGKYFVNQQPSMPAPAVQDADAAARLWTLSEQLSG